jgi:hypothetical protein
MQVSILSFSGTYYLDIYIHIKRGDRKGGERGDTQEI